MSKNPVIVEMTRSVYLAIVFSCLAVGAGAGAAATLLVLGV